jgi:hypothetical protein
VVPSVLMMTSPSTSAVNDPGSIVWPLWPLPTENLVVGGLQGFTGRATCSPATAGAATAGIDQAFPGRRPDISINSISAAPPPPPPTGPPKMAQYSAYRPGSASR